MSLYFVAKLHSIQVQPTPLCSESSHPFGSQSRFVKLAAFGVADLLRLFEAPHHAAKRCRKVLSKLGTKLATFHTTLNLRMVKLPHKVFLAGTREEGADAVNQ